MLIPCGICFNTQILHVTAESKCAETEYDTEHEVNVQEQPRRPPRRLSLVDIASVLDGENSMHLCSQSSASSLQKPPYCVPWEHQSYIGLSKYKIASSVYTDVLTNVTNFTFFSLLAATHHNFPSIRCNEDKWADTRYVNDNEVSDYISRAKKKY